MRTSIIYDGTAGTPLEQISASTEEDLALNLPTSTDTPAQMVNPGVDIADLLRDGLFVPGTPFELL